MANRKGSTMGNDEKTKRTYKVLLYSVDDYQDHDDKKEAIKALGDALAEEEGSAGGVVLENETHTILHSEFMDLGTRYTSARKAIMAVSPASQIKDPKDRFWYWINERYKIYLAKENGEEKPWTKDEVFQQYFFTTPYRELDKVTKWFAKNVRNPLNDQGSDDVFNATVIFRWFNTIEAGQILLDNNLFSEWKGDKARKLLQKALDDGSKIFTSAYLIAGKEGEPKIKTICDRITNVLKSSNKIIDEIRDTSLELATCVLAEQDGLGDFMGYEIVSDLRHTHLLDESLDIMTWANIGPGAARGLRRYMDETPSSSTPKNWRIQFQRILKESENRLQEGMPPFEMREVEHSLCEFDKFERIRLGDGRSKRLYKGI